MSEVIALSGVAVAAILSAIMIYITKREYQREVEHRSRKRQSDYFLFVDTVKVVFNYQEDAYVATGYTDDGPAVNWRSGWGSTPLEALTSLVTLKDSDHA